MHRIWHFVIGLGISGLWISLNAAGTGSAIGTSETGHGGQKTSYGFADAAALSVATPKSAFIDLGAEVEPVGIANNGVITLRVPNLDYFLGLARWRKGTTTALQIPPVSLYSYANADSSNLNLEFSPERGEGGVNCDGLLVASANDTIPNGTHYGFDREFFTVVWPVDSDAPCAIKGMVMTYPNADDPDQIIRESTAYPLTVDNGNGIWVDLDRLLIPTIFNGGNAGGRPAFSSGQLGDYDPEFGSPDISIFDANSSHQAIGTGVLDNYHGGYFVGAPTHWVDFVPFAFNDAGQVLGGDFAFYNFIPWPVLKADIYSAHSFQVIEGNAVIAPFVLTDSQRLYLQGIASAQPARITGFDEAGNVYGSVGADYDWWGGLIDPGQNVIWVAKPADWGLPADTPPYTPIAWETPALPAGYTSLYDVLPGARRIELGLAMKAEADGSTSTHGFALVPAQLRVDFNRDGVIDTSDALGAPDREFADKNLPYFFWVNDDDDAGETSGNDIPGQPPNAADALNDRVDGVRDLVDFFPVYLDIKRLLEVLPPSGGVTYKLSHPTGVLGYVLTDLTPATAGNYLRDAATATSLANAPVIPIPPAGTPLPDEFLEKIRTGDQGVILIEASGFTSFPLTLEVWKDTEKIATLELPLSIDSVEHMFRHINLSGAAGMAPETRSRGSAFNWDDRLSSSKALLFVHGYNVNQQQARGGQTEMFKRLWWSGNRARFWGVTWFGYETQTARKFTPDYHSNVVNAFATAPQFASFVAALRAEGATQICVAAHSLGNMVVSAAITDHAAAIDQYFLLDAAVAAEAYDAAEQQPSTATANMPHTDWTRKWNDVYPSRLWAAEWHARFPTNDGRRQLTWRDRFMNRHGTAFYDFYSSGEEVLAPDDGATRSIAGVLKDELYHFLFQDQPNGNQAWVCQEKLKGRTLSGKVVGSNYGGWGFNNFQFLKVPDVSGWGPVMAPSKMSPADAAAAAQIFTDDVLREVPFFDPGDPGQEVASWVPAPNDGGYAVLREPVGSLYGPDGSAFARRHRDTLLAQMIPAMSLAAGREAVEKFTRDAGAERNFDMNSVAFRGENFRWPAERSNTDWRHSDLREVAFPYVQNLFAKITELGGLKEP